MLAIARDHVKIIDALARSNAISPSIRTARLDVARRLPYPRAMDVTELLDTLNPAQRDAVSAPLGNTMVIAGAGSGKTRVLVHRIAWLMQVHGLSSQEILAVTFTNKAAREMRHRIEELSDIDVRNMWVGTFHGISHRLLRYHWAEAHLDEHFQILDADDQLRLVKRVHKSLHIDDSRWPPKQSMWFINKNKDAGIRPGDLATDGSYGADIMNSVYSAYTELCERSSLVDFSELLLRSYELLASNPELLEHYQRRFRYILVDEFQDTNALQYKWLKMLTGKNSHVMVVGDDDQSIYSWRGAQVTNIQQFAKEYPNTQTIRLEQNYRSTQKILAAANAIISYNTNRMGKELWTDGDSGEPISLYAAFNEIDEARFIINRTKQWIQEGGSADEIAILYRSNAQSRVFEEELISAGIPYKIYGGHKFFDRAEIKDALSYLRLLTNRNDDAAFERIVNTPTRGIGTTTLTMLREQAKQQQISLWNAAEWVITHELLPGRAMNAIKHFLTLITELAHNTEALSLPEQTSYVLKVSGLIEHYNNDKSDKARSRIENLDELVQACHSFNPGDHQMDNLTPLQAFLTHVALETSETSSDEHAPSVQLMTLHSAKGLEFDLVFIGGIEEGLFPHSMSLDDPNGLEEERRLCYVGMTRAKKKLYLSHAEIRNLHGKQQYHKVSRFVKEIPSELIEEIRMRSTIRRPVTATPSGLNAVASAHTGFVTDNGIKLGSRVYHQKFGEGVVLNYEGSGDSMRLQVNFANSGVKWLVASFANLEPI